MLLLVLLACSNKADLPPPPTAGGGSAVPTHGGSGDTDTDTDTDPGGGNTAATGDSGSGDSALVFSGSRPRSVLFISLDTTRKDWLARYGGPAETPNLDALFADSVVLDNHRSCSDWTWSSITCFQTSRRGTQLGWIADYSDETRQLSTDTIMGDGVLSERGYYTVLVSTNQFFDDAAHTANSFDELWKLANQSAEQVNAVALPLLDQLAEREDPWYLHVHYIDPHQPYAPPDSWLSDLAALDPIAYDLESDPGYRELADDWAGLSEDDRALISRHLELRYSAELAYVDESIGALLAHARSLGLLDDALLVFFTDHGEQLFDHEHLGHDDDLYEEENASVAAFSAPGLAPGTWSGPTVHQDLWPTVLDALGQPPEPAFQGIPVGGRAPDDLRLAERYLNGDTVQMVERDGVKLTYRWTGEKALYRLDGDPGERADAYDPADPDVIALWEILGPEVDAIYALKPDHTPVDPGP